MSKKNRCSYTHIKAVGQEIVEMLSNGKTQREISEYFGFRDKYVVKRFVCRHNRDQRRMEAGAAPRKKGRPSNGDISIESTKDYEIQRLRMENQLLRSFLQLAGRR